MSPLQRVLIAVVAAASCAPARADFAEVSAPGETPFLVSKDSPWTWEDLAGQGFSGITYAVYRSNAPDGGFTALRDGYLAPSWDGDPEIPSDRGVSLFHYLVTANDQSTDDSAGNASDGTPRVVELPPRCASGAAPIQESVPLRIERPERLRSKKAQFAEDLSWKTFENLPKESPAQHAGKALLPPSETALFGPPALGVTRKVDHQDRI